MTAGLRSVPLGEWHEAPPYLVTEEALGAFAAAVNETDADLLAGLAMPPTFPVVVAWKAQNRVLDGLLPDDLLGLHGEQAFAYERMLTPGTRVAARAQVAEIRRRSTGSTVTALTEITDDDGPVCRTRFTIFVVDGALEPFGEPQAELEMLADLPLLGETVETMSADQPDRYSAASGDTYRIHLDDEEARSLGLPRRIAHGMCTLAFAARAVRDEAAAQGRPRLRTLSARFTAPVFPGSTVTTSVRGREVDGELRLGFETTSGRATAISRGTAVAGR